MDEMLDMEMIEDETFEGEAPNLEAAVNSSVKMYLKEIGEYPLLTKEEEKQSNTHPRKQFLFKEEGCGLTGQPLSSKAPLYSLALRSSSATQDWSGSRARTDLLGVHSPHLRSHSLPASAP